MSNLKNPAGLPDEMIEVLLAQENVQEVLARVITELGECETSLEELSQLSYQTRAELLSAVVADGIIEIGAPEELTAEEFEEILEAEERAAEAESQSRNDD